MSMPVHRGRIVYDLIASPENSRKEVVVLSAMGWCPHAQRLVEASDELGDVLAQRHIRRHAGRRHVERIMRLQREDLTREAPTVRGVLLELLLGFRLELERDD